MMSNYYTNNYFIYSQKSDIYMRTTQFMKRMPVIIQITNMRLKTKQLGKKSFVLCEMFSDWLVARAFCAMLNGHRLYICIHYS